MCSSPQRQRSTGLTCNMRAADAVRFVTYALTIAVAAASLESAMGTAAVIGAAQQAVVLSTDGPPDSPAPNMHEAATSASGDQPGQAESAAMWNMAVAARNYLDQLFADQPEARQKVDQAWEKESGKGPSGSWGYAKTVAATFRSNKGGTEDRNISSSSSSSSSPCEVCEDLNMMYESDLPRYQSRMEELVVGRGYPLERHAVITPDGYELILFRIPHGARRYTEPGKRPVVLLHHGITLSSDAFVLYGSNESLGFILADAGFDVWMANQRGNTYSRRNINGIYPYQPEFWRFSIDTLAQLDLPTQVDYVLQATEASKIGYLGHSQGCMLVNLLCASKPEYNAKFSVLAEMAPVFFVQHLKQTYLRLGATLYFDQLLYLLHIGEFLPNRLTAPLLTSLCNGWPLDEVCAAAVSFFFFGPSRRTRPQEFKDIARTWPSSVGSRNMVHWSQNLRVSDNQFHYYDFGNSCNRTTWNLQLPRPDSKVFRESCNQWQYGTSTPPAYDLGRVTAPTIYFAGQDDMLSTAADIAEQQRRIGTASKGMFVYPGYSHMDFLWDRDMQAAADVVSTLRDYSPGTF